MIFLEDNGIGHLIVEDLTGLFSFPQYYHNNSGQYIVIFRVTFRKMF